MASKDAQKNWRDRKRAGLIRHCPCGKKLRLESGSQCQQCWLSTTEGRAYNQEKVWRSLQKFDLVVEAKAIASQFKNELGFVNRAALEESASKSELEVIKGVGFVNFHHRRDGQTTIYELAVCEGQQKQGWGRLLISRVLCSAIENKCDPLCGKPYPAYRIVAKCPVDLDSNYFYEKLGFKLVAVEPGKKRALNRWQYDFRLPLLFYCADGGRNEYGRIAAECGWRLGLRSTETDPNHYIPMIDNQWTDYNHDKHLALVKKYKPLICTAKDIESIEQLPSILKQARELAMYAGRVLLIPKIKTWLPPSYWLGYSVPTSHGGCDIEPEWFGNRACHLLGGSPNAQAQYAKLLNVVSLDANYAMRLASNGVAVWQGTELRKVGGCYETFRVSLTKQKEYWHPTEAWKKEPLFSLV